MNCALWLPDFPGNMFAATCFVKNFKKYISLYIYIHIHRKSGLINEVAALKKWEKSDGIICLRASQTFP